MRQKGIFRFKQFEIQQLNAAQKVGTDSDLLGALAVGGKDVLDIGAGTGVLSLMMAQRFPDARVTAVEIDDNAIKDLEVNIENSPYKDRVTMVHGDFVEFVKMTLRCAGYTNCHELSRNFLDDKGDNSGQFDSIVCNPPYFDLSLECPDESRTRARHSSSLPFEDLVAGAYALLRQNGVFTVCIPPEVEEKFDRICRIEGFWLDTIHRIKSVPEKPAKRLIITYRKGRVETPVEHIGCMRDEERNVSQWYKNLMEDFLL